MRPDSWAPGRGTSYVIRAPLYVRDPILQLHPIDGELQIELVGDIATLVGFTASNVDNKKWPGLNTHPGCMKWLIAGARFS